MASPVVEGTAESSVNTAGTSHTVTLPANIVSTDLVLITMDIGSTSATLNALANWSEVLDEAVANGLKILRYTGAGVPGNPTFTSSANTRSASIAWRISGADKSTIPQIGTTATGTSATPDPPASATPPATKDYLFIAFAGMAGEEADDDTWGNTPPTDYVPSPPLQKACGTAGTSLGGLIIAASRQLTTGAAQNPGTFGVDVSAAWRAQTITIHPPITATVNQITENDLGQEILWAPKNRLINQTTEIDTLQAITSGKAQLIGQITETDLAQVITVVQTYNQTVIVDQSSETDLAQNIAHSKVKTIAQATEIDLCQTTTTRKSYTLSQSTEADLAQAITRHKTKTVNQCTETDLSQTIAKAKFKSIVQSSETDLARTITYWIHRLITAASEIDLAQVISTSSDIEIDIDQVIETDSSQNTTANKHKTVGQTSESNAVFSITSSKTIVVVQNFESDEAASITANKVKTINTVFETDSVVTISPYRTVYADIDISANTDINAIGFSIATRTADISGTGSIDIVNAPNTKYDRVVSLATVTSPSRTITTGTGTSTNTTERHTLRSVGHPITKTTI
jgi:hypothetical protein